MFYPPRSIEINKKYDSFINLDFQNYLSTNFRKIKKEIDFLETNSGILRIKPASFFSQLIRVCFLNENLFIKLKKIISSRQISSIDQQVNELTAKLKKLSWFKLFFIGIFFWSKQSKARIFEELEWELVTSIYWEKISRIKVFVLSLEQSLSSSNVEVFKLIENQTLASRFIELVSLVDSLAAFLIPKHLRELSLAKFDSPEDIKKAQLMKNLELFTRHGSFFWEIHLLPKEEIKINKKISDLEKQQNIILEKVYKLRQEFENAVRSIEKNIFFQIDSHSNWFKHLQNSKLSNTQEDFFRKLIT